MNFIETTVVILELLEVHSNFEISSEVKGLRVLLCTSHVLFPLLVDHLEKLGFSGKLFDDILSIENVFEVHPLALEGQPLINEVSKVDKLLLHCFDGAFNLLNELGAHHGRHSHSVIFENSDQFLDLSDDETILRVTVTHHNEIDSLPSVLDDLHGGFNLHFTLRTT